MAKRNEIKFVTLCITIIDCSENEHFSDLVELVLFVEKGEREVEKMTLCDLSMKSYTNTDLFKTKKINENFKKDGKVFACLIGCITDKSFNIIM